MEDPTLVYKEEIQKLKEENDKLKRAFRFQFLTLGFYRTPYNYNGVRGDCTIVSDKGAQAVDSFLTTLKLGFTPKEITSWPGPAQECPWECEHEPTTLSDETKESIPGKYCKKCLKNLP